MAPMPTTLSDPEVTLAAWKLLTSTLQEIQHLWTNYDTFSCLHTNWKAYMARNFNCLKDFSRSQTVMHTVKVVICRKWCNVETLSQENTSRKWYDLSNRHFWWPWLTFAIFHKDVQRMTRFQLSWPIVHFLHDTWASFCQSYSHPHISTGNLQLLLIYTITYYGRPGSNGQAIMFYSCDFFARSNLQGWRMPPCSTFARTSACGNTDQTG